MNIKNIYRYPLSIFMVIFILATYKIVDITQYINEYLSKKIDEWSHDG